MKKCTELDHKKLMERLINLSEEYSFIRLSYIGTSVMGRPIPVVVLGDEDAKRGVLYVSTHHAMENICTSVMLDFIEDYASSYREGRFVYGINSRVLYKMRKIHIVPMLNPDGVEYRLHGLSEDNPIRERLLQYNEGEDFSHWNANGRGVDLNHNYDAYLDEYKNLERENNITYGRTRYSGESPESEPEVSALANYIRFHEAKLDGILTFHTQGEEIYYKSRGKEIKRASYLAEAISRFTKYKVSEAEGLSSFGGLTDWFIKEFDKPSFTLECGKGDNPLDISSEWDIYCRLRELMYNFPILL